jgi:hypothetical protein
MADHTEAIKNVLKEAFIHRGFMGVVNFEDFVTEMFENTGLSYQVFSDALDEGVQDGIPLSLQLEFMKIYLFNKK